MRLVLRRNLKPPTLEVDNGRKGYTVRFARVKVGCVFKHMSHWYIKRNEDVAIMNGTTTEAMFWANQPVWITSMDYVKPVAGAPMVNI